MIYDLQMFSGETDMLEIKLNILSPFVDKFIICEGMETFSGNPKVAYWLERDRDRFEEWESKIIYHVIIGQDEPDINAQMEGRPYVDEPHFKRAFYQKEMLRKVLEQENPQDEDIIIYGDTDEVINPEIIGKIDDTTHKLRQLAYSYYLNNRSPEDWRGTIITKYKNLKGQCLNDLRANPVEADIWDNGGWHWTNLGGIEAIRQKIESYDHQEVNIPWVKDGLEERFRLNVDFLGRGFRMWQSEEGLPQFVLDNKERYKHLWKS